MRVREVIRADKTNIKVGPWQDGNMPPGQFRLRANMKTFRQGRSYRWQVITFDALGASFRVLLVLNLSKHIFRATLGIMESGEARIVCVREFHASEPGWHCHAVLRCDDGVSYWNHTKLARRPFRPDPSAPFDITTDSDATARALRFYRIEERGPLL